MSATNEEYILSWSNYGNNFSILFENLLQGNELIDVQLVAEGHLIGAHRLILSAMSPYFCNIFTQMPVNQQAFVFLKDISKETVANLVKYIYRGEVNVKSDCLDEFMNAAKALNINGLANGDYCQSFESQPKNQYPAKRYRFDGSVTYQTPNFDHSLGSSADFQYQSVQRSVHTMPYQQPINKYKKEDTFDLNDDPNRMDREEIVNDSNDKQNYDDEIDTDNNINNNCSMNDYNDTSTFDQWNGGDCADSNDNELKTMATAPKRYKTTNDPSEYVIVANVQVNRKDGENLFYANNKYNKNGKPNRHGQQRWKCTKEKSQKCHAAASTMDMNGVTMMKILMAEHTHRNGSTLC